MAATANITRRAALSTLSAVGALALHPIRAMAGPDPFPALLAERRALEDQLRHVEDDAALARISDRLTAIDVEMIAAPATTPAGAATRLALARDEYLMLHDQGSHGDRVFLALVDSALNVLRTV
jgi:hypothetical protein